MGKKANIADTFSPNLAGILDPFQEIIFNASNADVELVMVNEEVIKRNEQSTKLNWAHREVRDPLRRIRSMCSKIVS